MAGGSLARGQDAFETAVGAIIDGMSVISLVVLYSRLKRMRFVVLPWGIVYSLVPPASLFILGVFLAAANGKQNTQNRITESCDSIVGSPFTDVTVSQFRQVCIQESQQYLTRTAIWTFVRAAFQVFLAGFIALWTYWRVIELRRKNNNSFDNPFGDNQAIPFTTNAAPVGKSEYDVVVDGGQFVSKPPLAAPGYAASNQQGPQGLYPPPLYPPPSR